MAFNHKLVDAICGSCGHTCELFMHRITHEFDKEDEECPKCKKGAMLLVDSGPRPTKLHDPEVRKESLKKRSIEHSKGLIKEKFAQMREAKRKRQ